MANLKQRLNRRNSRTSYTLFIEKQKQDTWTKDREKP